MIVRQSHSLNFPQAILPPPPNLNNKLLPTQRQNIFGQRYHQLLRSSWWVALPSTCFRGSYDLYLNVPHKASCAHRWAFSEVAGSRACEWGLSVCNAGIKGFRYWIYPLVGLPATEMSHAFDDFFTPDNSQARDVRENSCNQTLSLDRHRLPCYYPC